MKALKGTEKGTWNAEGHAPRTDKEGQEETQDEKGKKHMGEGKRKGLTGRKAHEETN